MIINEISKKCSVSIDTLRYYDKIGLLKPKRDNHKRLYSDEDIKKLRSIKIMKNMQFSLAEIKELLELDQQIDTQLDNKASFNPKVLEALLIKMKNKLKDVIRHEEEIRHVKKQLNHIIDKIKNGINYD